MFKKHRKCCCSAVSEQGEAAGYAVIAMQEKFDALTKAIEAARPITVHSAREIARILKQQDGDV